MYRSTIIVACLAIATPAISADNTTEPTDVMPVAYVENTGDVARITSSKRLRTYSQEVAAAACFYHNDIDSAFSREVLIEAKSNFDVRLDALRDGNESLGMVGGEERPKTLAMLAEVGAIWTDVAASVDGLVANQNDAGAADAISARHAELFEKTDALANEMTAQYANPSVITQAGVLSLEMVGRQAMLAQKMAGDACQVIAGKGSPDILRTLSESASVYDATLDALINGMPALGLRAAPTPEIAGALREIKMDWGTVRPIVDTLVRGGSVDRDMQVYLFKHMVAEMTRLEEVSQAYAEDAKYDS